MVKLIIMIIVLLAGFMYLGDQSVRRSANRFVDQGLELRKAGWILRSCDNEKGFTTTVYTDEKVITRHCFEKENIIKMLTYTRYGPSTYVFLRDMNTGNWIGIGQPPPDCPYDKDKQANVCR